jgi:opacity protein-like surface antigen
VLPAADVRSFISTGSRASGGETNGPLRWNQQVQMVTAMRSRTAVPVLVLAATLTGSVAVPAAEAERAQPGLIHGRLSLGLRVSHWSLSDSRRYAEDGSLDNHNPGNFLGSLWGLDPKQNWIPLPCLEYRVFSGFGIGAAYDQQRIKTLDWADDDKTTVSGDGDLQLRGAQVFAFGRYRNHSRFTPLARAGWGYYWAAFYENAGWQPPRWMEVENSHGWFGGVGVEIAVKDQLGADVSFEHMALSDITAKAHLLYGGHKNGVFPVSGNALRLGVRFTF